MTDWKDALQSHTLQEREDYVESVLTEETVNIEDGHELALFTEQIQDIFDTYKSQRDCVSRRAASELKGELLGFMDDIILGLLMEQGKLEAAFLLAGSIFEMIDTTAIDDQEYVVRDTMRRCHRIWKQTIDTCDDALEDKAFRWFADRIREGKLKHVARIEKIWMENFRSLSYGIRKLEVIDEKLSQYRSQEMTDGKQEQRRPQDLKKWMDMRIALMENWDFPLEYIDDFEKAYWQYPEVRKNAIERYIKAKEKEKAIALLKESREMDKDDPALVAHHSKKLAAMYRTADQARYRQELHDILVKYDPCDLSTFRKLRFACQKDEWRQVRNALFDELGSTPGAAELYIEEGEYNRLMAYVKERSNIQELIEFEGLLGEKYALDIMTVYEKVLDELAEKAYRRSEYQQLVIYLRRMKRYPGGDRWAHRIADRWRDRYGRKLVLMRELIKL